MEMKELMEVFSGQWEEFTKENSLVGSEKFQLPVFNLLTSSVKPDAAADYVTQLKYPEGTDTIYVDFVEWVSKKAGGGKQESELENTPEDIQMLREAVARYLYSTATVADTFVIQLKK